MDGKRQFLCLLTLDEWCLGGWIDLEMLICDRLVILESGRVVNRDRWSFGKVGGRRCSSIP